MNRILAIEESALSAYAESVKLERPGPEAASNSGPSVGGVARKPGSVVVYPISGVIRSRGFAGYFGRVLGSDDHANNLEKLANDPEVKAIVLDVNSPGGDVAGTPELAATIASIRESKPIVASVSPMAASAAYWLASQCTEICCQPSGQVGSIGVILAHVSYEQYLNNEGVKITMITSGKFKGEGNPYQDLTEEARSRFQGLCDTIYSDFISAVAKGRGVTPSVVKSDFGEGGMVLAKEAKGLGMIDRIETLSETMKRLGATRQAGTKSKSLLAARHELVTLE